MGKPRNIKARLDEAEARVKLAECQLRLDVLKVRKRATKLALSTYQAAKRDRTNRDWKSPNVSADQAIIPDSPLLNARARAMIRDNKYAQSIVRSFKRNVVGTGIWPSFSATDRNGAPLANFNRIADAKWFDWSTNPLLVDATGRRSFIDVQRWVISEVVGTGEAFVVWRYDLARQAATGESGLVLTCVESEQLDTTLNTWTEGKEVREVRGGIEVDRFGKPVAFHFYVRHPNDAVPGAVSGNWQSSVTDRLSDTWDRREAWEKGDTFGYPRSIRVPAEFVLHIYDPERSYQNRGVSRFHSVLSTLRDLDQFEYAELLKAKAQACIGFAITSDGGSYDNLGLKDSGGETDPRTDTDGNDEFSMQPIMVARLAQNENIQPFTPTSPGGQFSPFVMQQLRGIAAGVGLSYEQVARDFTNGSFSSQRQSLLEDRREFETLIQLICTKLCQPVAARFVEFAVLEGLLPSAGPMASLSYVKWRPQGWQWIDPQKEIEAHAKALELGLETKESILGEKGEDWREVAQQGAVERKYEATLATDAGEPDAETFNGAPVQSAVEVLIGVSSRTLSPETAVQMLVQFFKLPEEVARRMVQAQSAVTNIPIDNATTKPGAKLEVAA